MKTIWALKLAFKAFSEFKLLCDPSTQGTPYDTDLSKNRRSATPTISAANHNPERIRGGFGRRRLAWR